MLKYTEERKLNNYKIIIEYVGFKYNGWQKQGNTKNTIQGKFENILLELTGENVEINASGRTDAGVHAKGQVANFKTNKDYPCDYLKNYFNKYLPDDVRVLSVEKASDRFHARLNAKAKTYEYKIANVEKASVFEHKFSTFIEEKLDVGKMIKASEKFLGTHDFKAFCSNKRYKKSTVREIYDIDISTNDNIISIKIHGNGFLYNMVRIMVGTLVEVGLGKLKPEDIPEILRSKDREKAGYTMPPQGLALIKVEY